MRIIDNYCDTCLHKKVCKNVENAKNINELTKEIIINKNDKLNFTIKIICDDYCSISTADKNNSRLDVPTPNINPFHNDKLDMYNNPCEGCPTYELLKNTITPYIGDLPCQWCNRNSYKLVCGLATPNPCENKATTKTPNYKNSCASNSTETNIMD